MFVNCTDLGVCLALGRRGTLKIQEIIFSDPSENAPYIAEIRFLPIGAQYTGDVVALDTVRYSSVYGQFYAESTLLIDVPEHRRLQMWTLGPWCDPVEGFVYTAYGPRHGEECVILDEDGFLTRGIVAILRAQWLSSGSPLTKPLTLKEMALDRLLKDLEDYLDTACYTNVPVLFSGRKRFEGLDLMYYQKVDQDECGDYRTVRIRPSNHSYVMDWNDFMRHCLAQKDFYHGITERNRTLSTLIVGTEGVKTYFPRCDPMTVFLDDVTLDDVAHKNYTSSKIVVADIAKEWCVFRWAIQRPNGWSCEERRVALESKVLFRTCDHQRLKEQYVSLYKMNTVGPFLKIGPVYTVLDALPEEDSWDPKEKSFFKRTIQEILDGRPMSFLRYLDA